MGLKRRDFLQRAGWALAALGVSEAGLFIALGAGLERIERVDATSAFATIPHVSLVIAGEQPADYLFGRVQEAKTQLPATSSSSLPSRSGLPLSFGFR